MEDKDYTLIERYLSQDMSPEEQLEIERRAQIDPDFGRELSAYQLAVESIKLAQREELKNRLRQRDKMLDKQTQDKKPGINRRLLFLAVAAIFVVLIALQFLTRQDRPIDQAQISPQDTTRVEQPAQEDIEPINNDRADNESPNEVDEKDKPKKSIINKDRGRELYAANFEPYMDDALDPTSRSGVDDMTDYEKFEYYYWERDHANVVAVFNRLEPAYRNNDNLKFLYANALMATNRLDEAEAIMKEVMHNKKSLYHTEAIYYVALINIQKGDVDAARRNLEAYIMDPQALEMERAKLLLKALQ